MSATQLPTAASHAPAGARRRQTVAVVLMTRNEARRLAACLDRVKGWADEIVVIDDLSTDATVEIARRYTDKVFSYACEDDHCRQWNRGIDHAESDWILHIDADEWVTPQLQRAIDARLSRPCADGAIEIMRRNIFLGHPMRYGGWYHRHRILFRRTAARCVGRGIHAGARLRVEGPIGFLDADIEHRPFDSLEQYIARQNHYTSVEAAAVLAEQGRPPLRRVAFQMGVRPVKLFWKSYVKRQGYRDGWLGLAFGLLGVFSHVLLWMKYWELAQAPPRHEAA